MKLLAAAGALAFFVCACASAPTDVADAPAAVDPDMVADMEQAIEDGRLNENAVLNEEGEILVPYVKLAGDPDQEICKVREMTGSRVRGVKTCMTRREWAEVRAENQRFLDRGYQATDQE